MTTAELVPPFDATIGATLLVDEVIAALVNSRIYQIEHPRVQNSIATVRRAVQELAQATGDDAVSIGCADDLIFFQQRPLLGASFGAARLISILAQWGSGGITLAANLEPHELSELLLAVAARPQPGHNYTNVNATLVTRRCHHARLLPPYAEGGPGGVSRSTIHASSVRVGMRFFQSVIDLLQNVTVSVCRGGHIDFAPVQAQAEIVLKQLADRAKPLLGLARQDQYDAFTFGHSLRVAILSMHFAQSLTDDRDLLIRIGTAALLHDVGKSLIPFEILHSTGSLNEEERRQMNRHAELGAACLLDHNDSDPIAVAAAFGHHKAPDGSGYPQTAHRHTVSMVTSIVKICDVFEALTAARPYKRPMSPIRAYRVMIAMGNKLDRRLLRRFIELNGIYPNGQFVELATGEVARVEAQSGNPLQPIIALLDDPSASDLVDEDRELLDLSDIACHGARAILSELTPDQMRERLDQRS